MKRYWKNNAKTTTSTKRHNEWNVSNFDTWNSCNLFLLVQLWTTTDTNAKEQDSMLKLKWHILDAKNWNKNTTMERWRNLSLIKNNKDKSVKMLILSNIMSLINNGMRIFSRHSKKMHRLLDLLRIDILRKLSKIDKLLKRSFHLTSSFLQDYWISKSNKHN